jgi:hypothetical protein
MTETYVIGYIFDSFESLIVNNNSLSNIQKFNYFVSALRGEAKDLIAHLAITSDNFTIDRSLICSRYSNVKLIVTRHIQQLFQLPTVKKGDAH